LNKKDKSSHTKHNSIPISLKKLYESGESKETICVYAILCKENCIPTARIVDLALSPDFESECITCASADGVYRALKNLQEKGLIIGQLSNKGYIWQILNES